MIHIEPRKFFSYAIILFILLVTASANPVTTSKGFSIGGWIFFTGVYFYFENLIKPKLILLFGIFIALLVFYYLQNNAINTTTYIGLFINILLCYYCRDLTKEHFYDYFTNVMYVFACISLVIYPFQFISFETLYNINNIFRLEVSEYDWVNSFIHTTTPIHKHRNAGFTWEPGGFATILTLTYFLNIFQRKEPLKSKKNIIFLITLLTTQSTMGITSLVFPFGIALGDLILSNKIYKQLSIIIIPTVIVIFSVIFFQVDFLYKKIVNEFGSLDVEMGHINYAIEKDLRLDISRSASFALDWPTIKEYPVLGLGVDYRTTSFHLFGYHDKLQGSCGWNNLLLRFGFIGFIFYAYLFYRFSDFSRRIEKIAWVLLIFYTLFTEEYSPTPFFHLFIF